MSTFVYRAVNFARNFAHKHSRHAEKSIFLLHLHGHLWRCIFPILFLLYPPLISPTRSVGAIAYGLQVEWSLTWRGRVLDWNRAGCERLWRRDNLVVVDLANLVSHDVRRNQQRNRNESLNRHRSYCSGYAID